MPLANDPVPVDVSSWVYCTLDHLDFQAVEKMLDKKLPIVSVSDKRGFRIEETG
jgi:hypothetical protein